MRKVKSYVNVINSNLKRFFFKGPIDKFCLLSVYQSKNFTSIHNKKNASNGKKHAEPKIRTYLYFYLIFISILFLYYFYIIFIQISFNSFCDTETSSPNK